MQSGYQFQPIYASLEECFKTSFANKNESGVDGDRDRLTNLWVNDEKELPLDSSKYQLHEELNQYFKEYNFQGNILWAGHSFLIGNLFPEVIPNNNYAEMKNEYFILSNQKMIYVETFYFISYKPNIVGVNDQYAERGKYDVKYFEKIDSPSNLAIKDDELYITVEKNDATDKKYVRYYVKSPTGQILTDIITDNLPVTIDISNVDIYLPEIFKVTAARGHTRPLFPIAKSVTISLIHVDENKKLAAKLLKHARFVLDEKNNDILFSNEQNHVFKRFNSSQQDVDFEAELLILSYLLLQDKELSETNQNYQTPEWLTKKKQILLNEIYQNSSGTSDSLGNFLIIMKKLQDDNSEEIKKLLLIEIKKFLLDGSQSFDSLKTLLMKSPCYVDNKNLQLLIRKFNIHISQLESLGSDKESLKKDLSCVVNAIFNDTPQNLFKLHHRVETNLASRNKQVIGATAATVAASLCVVGGLTLFAPATLPAAAAVTIAGLATAGAGAAGTKKVKETAEEKRVTPATYEEQILDTLLQQYVDDGKYGKFVLYEWEFIKSGIESRGVKNTVRDELIAQYETKIKHFTGNVTEMRNMLVNCRTALPNQSSTSETAKEITNIITKLSNHHFLSLMKKEFDCEQYTSYMLLRLNNIIANAKLRKADTKRDKILESFVSYIESLDVYTIQKPNFSDEISGCIKDLRALSRNSTTALELEQLQSELNLYAERYVPPVRHNPLTMSCGM